MEGPPPPYSLAIMCGTSPKSMLARIARDGLSYIMEVLTMGRSAKKAAQRIAKILSCSYEQARAYCEEVQNICDNSCPSFNDIAKSLESEIGKVNRIKEIRIERISEKASIRHKRRIVEEEEKSEEENNGKRKYIKTHSDERTEVFKSSDGKDRGKFYKEWISKNRSAYVLNVKGNFKNPMIHSANCDHIQPQPDDSENEIVKNTKVCSTNKKRLKGYALQRGQQPQNCQRCDP